MEQEPAKAESVNTFDLLPWYWQLTYLLVTIGLLIPAVIYVLLAIINPFWFREAMLESAVTFVEGLEVTRLRIMKPALRKYTIFETLKRGENVVKD
jgi:hypothetical protein